METILSLKIYSSVHISSFLSYHCNECNLRSPVSVTDSINTGSSPGLPLVISLFLCVIEILKLRISEMSPFLYSQQFTDDADFRVCQLKTLDLVLSGCRADCLLSALPP